MKANPDSLTATPPAIKEMAELSLLNLRNGVGMAGDGRVVIGQNMDLRKLKPYLGQGYGLIDDEDLLAKFAEFSASSTINTFPKLEVDGPEIKKEKCEICQSLGIDGVVQKVGEDNKKLVVMSQGLLASRDCISNQWVRFYLSRAGIDVLCFDYFEGENKVDVSFQKRVQDLKQIITKYSNEGYEVGGYGSSVGGSAMWMAASLLNKDGVKLKAIANRTIIPDLLGVLAKRGGLNPQFIRANMEQVRQEIISKKTKDGSTEQIRMSAKELKEICKGKFNLGKYVDIRCPILDVQGSEDTIAGMNLVRNVMRQLKQFNESSQLVEVVGATHGSDNPKDYIVQMYLLISFLKKHMLEGLVTNY